jgi:hypothetical protein
MTYQSRSLDDLPLAAYTTGVEPDPEPEAGAPHAAVAATVASAPAVVLKPPVDPANLPADPAGLASDPPRSLPALSKVPEWLAHPREHRRDPRLVLSGVVAIGVVLLVASLMFGGGGPAGVTGANASPTTPAFVPTAAPPAGAASVEATGKVGAGTRELTGMTGTGPAVAQRIESTWGDDAGTVLGLSGAASAGTRTTDTTFVLTWTVVVNGAPVTFTSDSGECTIGMAVQPKQVSGSFTCKKLRSPDGKVTVDVRGTYRT